jgi:ATP-dependent Lon protease
MTGELSLIGKVLPVGGIKEKLLAARRAGITTVILPKLNEKDLHEVPEYALKGMTLRFVSHVEEVFELVLEKGGVPKGKRASGKVIRSASGKPAKAKLKPAKGKKSRDLTAVQRRR